MSKKLLKILAICVFVTLIPVAIVAIAMAATLSAPYTVKVEIKGELESLAPYYCEVSISVNDIEKEGNSVGVKTNDKVTIAFEGVAYDVKGIYDGNANSITDASKPLDNKSSYSFVVSEDRTLTIWIEPKSFDISYSSEELVSEKLTFGDNLGVISGEDFVGWTIESAPEGVEINSQVYTKATFPISGSYTLAPSYSKYMTISYYSGDKLIVSDKVYQNNYIDYNLRDVNDEKISNAINNGYSFGGWATAAESGDEITTVPTFVIGKEYKIYLVQDLNSYKVNVKFHDASDSISELNFDVKNGFAEYISRENYNLKAFKYEDKLYYANDTKTEFTSERGEKLSQIIASEVTPSDIAQLVAVWEVNNANYDNTEDYYSFYFYARDSKENNLEYMKNGEYITIQDSGTINMHFNSDPNFDLNQSLFDYYLGMYGQLYGSSGEVNEYSIRILFEDSGSVAPWKEESLNSENKATFADLIDAVKDNSKLIYVYFEF